ncbi:hypothetical protein AB0J90_24805 [Micromonospora sp. NPDC049523]|uniref:NucA/NucB deoxyribonuclease domain-containing protein n=1 Tax=Micromonospora sp. NPDC049523 TaxID=3155921 RepID=UPI0034246925
MPDSNVRRGLLALAAAVTCAVALLPAQPAAAAPDDPAALTLSQRALPAACAPVLAAAVQKTAGKGGTATCAEMGKPTRTTTPAQAAPDGAGTAVTCGNGAWAVERFGACATVPLTLYVYLIPSGQLIGIIDMTATFMADLGSIDGRPRYNVTVRATTLLGQVIGTYVSHEGFCEYGCNGFTGGGLQRFDYVGAQANFILNAGTTATAPGAVHQARMKLGFWFLNATWTPPESNVVGASSLEFRCDNAVPGFNQPGCVYPSIRPVYRPSPANGSYVQHIRMALNHGVTGTLTRMTDPFNQTQNHNRACPGMYTAPDGYSCDEYPFRSTLQGAFTGGHSYGRTFAGCQIDWVQIRQPGDNGGWNVCYIPAFENSSGGNELNRFYESNRVIDNDVFQVVA